MVSSTFALNPKRYTACRGVAQLLKYLFPILFRYSSLILQFLVVILVTRKLGREEAGVYFEVFGIINASYFLFGLGLPDGLVRFVAHADATDKASEIRSMIGRACVATVPSTVVMLMIGLVFGLWFESALVTRVVVAATAAWWVCYGVTFFASQILVATGRASLGAFFFYPAMNIALFVTSVPYLVFAMQPQLDLTLMAAVAGGLLCAVAAIVCAVAATLSYPVSTARVPIGAAFRLGASIGVSRVLQSCLYWIPVWAVGFWQGLAAAALFATASRLNVAVAAVMAAIRFTIRPSIVRLAARDDWDGIGREGRRTATLATAIAIVGIVGTTTIGPSVISLVFGDDYRGAAWVLAILMIGTLGECVGGAVDEVLKMTGQNGFVLRLLGTAVVVEVLLVMASAGLGVSAAASAQALVFVVMYGTMLWVVKRHKGTWVGATMRPSELRSLFRS